MNCTHTACTAYIQLILQTYKLYANMQHSVQCTLCTHAVYTENIQYGLHPSSLYCTPTAPTLHPQSVLHAYNMCCTHRASVHTNSLYCTYTMCTAHVQHVKYTQACSELILDVLHTYSLYWAYIPLLHTCIMDYTNSAHV
jgi:hypothetical protein